MRRGVEEFVKAGRALAHRGAVRGAEGNLSTWDGSTLRITRTGAPLGRLTEGDVLEGTLRNPPPRSSSDLAVHVDLYERRGPGAVLHAHPPGSPQGEEPGRHGVYRWSAGGLLDAVREEFGEVDAGSAGTSASPLGVRPVEWRSGTLRLLDQTKLPRREAYRRCRSVEDVCRAISELAVRGAPILGITAAYGMALAARRSDARSVRALVGELERAARDLVATRPTAVNIRWAVERVLERARRDSARGVAAIRDAVLDEARAIEREDEEACRAMGIAGAELVPDGARVLTHCNTGMLCTAGWGTAQGVIYAAHVGGKRVRVWVDETRPVLQGARLTAWELQRLGVPMTLLPDNAAGSVMARGEVDLVVVGADRIAANGDVANKVGTYPLAVLAEHHGVPFYVAAPTSTVDLSCPDGGAIAIEQRDAAEVTAPLGVPFAPEGTPAHNPAFDVTPAALVSGIVTEKGVARPPYPRTLRALAQGPAAEASAR